MADAAQCAACSKPLSGAIVALGAEKTRYHKDCVKCAECDEKLVCGTHNNQLLCMEHYALAKQPKCAACVKPISGGYREITGGKEKWHPECFVCTVCSEALTAGLQIKDGQLYCIKDFAELNGTRCAGCQDIITGQKLVSGENPQDTCTPH